MKYRVRLTASAERDAEAALRWFDEQATAAAGTHWFRQMLARIHTLESHPQRYPLAAESEDLGMEIRELLFGRRRGTYRILFQISGPTVQILRIRHAARSSLSDDDI